MDRYNEVWRELADFPNYLFSNHGRIKNRNTNRILKGSNNNHGYLTCRIKNNNGKFITKDIHRLIAKCFLSNFNNNLQVNHIDGNKHNNRIDNLEMVTGKENMAHALKHNLLHPSHHIPANACSVVLHNIITNENIKFNSLLSVFQWLGYNWIPPTYYRRLKRNKPLIFKGFLVIIK